MIIFRLLSVLLTFFYPAYASYKALKVNDYPGIERWLMYWAIIGTMGLVEGFAEFILSWMPFYWEIKTILIIWLTAPQTQGATYVYRQHLAPFLQAHESEIDQAISAGKRKAHRAASDWLQQAWSSSGLGFAAGSTSSQEPSQATRATPHPDALASPSQDPWSAPASQLGGIIGTIWHRFGPAVLATGHGYAQGSENPTSSASEPNNSRISSQLSFREKERRRLLSELAKLDSLNDSRQTTKDDSLFAPRSVSSSGDELEVNQVSGSEGNTPPKQPVMSRNSSWFRRWSSTASPVISPDKKLQ